MNRRGGGGKGRRRRRRLKSMHKQKKKQDNYLDVTFISYILMTILICVNDITVIT
jgi:hypothetical protein